MCVRDTPILPFQQEVPTETIRSAQSGSLFLFSSSSSPLPLFLFLCAPLAREPGHDVSPAPPSRFGWSVCCLRRVFSMIPLSGGHPRKGLSLPLSRSPSSSSLSSPLLALLFQCHKIVCNEGGRGLCDFTGVLSDGCSREATKSWASSSCRATDVAGAQALKLTGQDMQKGGFSNRPASSRAVLCAPQNEHHRLVFALPLSLIVSFSLSLCPSAGAS